MPQSLVAFFGATGGCALSGLVMTINAGVPARALVRDPAKLESLLVAAGVTKETLTQHLKIFPGNALEEKSIKWTLRDDSGTFASLVVFGIGAKPKFTPMPSINNPNVCENAMKALLAAIRSLPFDTPPFLVAISSTGISETRDVPYFLLPIYRGILKIPLKDKHAMEDEIVGASPVLRGFTIGAHKIKVGTGGNPAIGYSISRKDVGAWMYRELVAGDAGLWAGQKVSLTS